MTHKRSQCIAVACPVPRAADVQAICLLLATPHSLEQAHCKGLGARARTVEKCNIALQEETISQARKEMLRAAE